MTKVTARSPEDLTSPPAAGQTAAGARVSFVSAHQHGRQFGPCSGAWSLAAEAWGRCGWSASDP